MFFVLAVVATLVRVLYDWNILDLENTDLNIWVGDFTLSAVLGIGLGRSIVRRMLSGLCDVDNIER